MRAPSLFLPLAALIVCVGVPAAAAELHLPDRARRAVVDDAHVLDAGQVADLERRLLAYNAATHHQLVLATVPTLQGDGVKDFANRLFRAWRLGHERRNDGVLLLLSREPRKVRIEVGYGLEPVLTDALTSFILQTRVVPRLHAGHFASGLSAGVDAIIAATGGAPEPRAAPNAFEADYLPAPPLTDAVAAERKHADDLRTVVVIFGSVGAFFVALFVLFIWLCRRSARQARMIGPRRPDAAGLAAASGASADTGWSGSSPSSGGGFDSGGGSSGGGGADSSY